MHQAAFFFFNLGIHSNSGWPWTHFSPFASEFWVLRLYVWGHHTRLVSFEFYCTVYSNNKKSWRKNSWAPIIIFIEPSNGYRFCHTYVCIIYVWVCLWVFTHVFFVCDSSVAQIKDLAHARQTLYYRCIPLTLTFSFSIIFLWKLTSHFHSHYFNILSYSDINMLYNYHTINPLKI